MTLRGWWIFPELIALVLVVIVSTAMCHVIVLSGETMAFMKKDFPIDLSVVNAVDITYGTHYSGPYADKYYPETYGRRIYAP